MKYLVAAEGLTGDSCGQCEVEGSGVGSRCKQQQDVFRCDAVDGAPVASCRRDLRSWQLSVLLLGYKATTASILPWEIWRFVWLW